MDFIKLLSNKFRKLILVFIKNQAMSKLLSSSIEDGAVNLTSLKQFRAMLTSSGPNCFADVILKVSHRVFVVVNQLWQRLYLTKITFTDDGRMVVLVIMIMFLVVNFL